MSYDPYLKFCTFRSRPPNGGPRGASALEALPVAWSGQEGRCTGEGNGRRSALGGTACVGEKGRLKFLSTAASRRIVWQWPAPGQQLRLLACRLLCARQWHGVAEAAQGLPVLQHGPTPPASLAPTRHLPDGMATARLPLRSVAGHHLGSASPRRLEKAGKKGGEQTGPSPVDRGK